MSALHFAARVRRRMALTGRSRRDVAAATGVSLATVSAWRVGRYVPDHDTAAALASCLHADDLAQLANATRQRVCDQCGLGFEATDRRDRARFCTRRCQGRWWGARRHSERLTARQDGLTATRHELEDARRDLQAVRATIAAFCAACELDGLCRMPDCELRPESPLPLAKAA